MCSQGCRFWYRRGCTGGRCSAELCTGGRCSAVFLFGATASAATASAGTIWGRAEEFFFHLTASQTSKVLLVNEVKFEDSDYH